MASVFLPDMNALASERGYRVEERDVSLGRQYARAMIVMSVDGGHDLFVNPGDTRSGQRFSIARMLVDIATGLPGTVVRYDMQYNWLGLLMSEGYKAANQERALQLIVPDALMQRCLGNEDLTTDQARMEWLEIGGIEYQARLALYHKERGDM